MSKEFKIVLIFFIFFAISCGIIYFSIGDPEENNDSVYITELE